MKCRGCSYPLIYIVHKKTIERAINLSSTSGLNNVYHLFWTGRVLLELSMYWLIIFRQHTYESGLLNIMDDLSYQSGNKLLILSLYKKKNKKKNSGNIAIKKQFCFILFYNTVGFNIFKLLFISFIGLYFKHIFMFSSAS